MEKKILYSTLVACCFCIQAFGADQSYFSVPDDVWKDFSRKIKIIQTETDEEEPLVLVQLDDGSYVRALGKKTPRLNVNTPVPVLWSKGGHWNVVYIRSNSVPGISVPRIHPIKGKDQQADAIQLIGLDGKNLEIALATIVATQKELKAFVGIECDDRYAFLSEIISKNPSISRFYVSRSEGATFPTPWPGYEYLLTEEGRKRLERECPDVIEIVLNGKEFIGRVTTRTDAVVQISTASNEELHSVPVVDLLPHRCKYDARTIKIEGLNEHDTILALFGMLSTQAHLDKIVIKNCKLSPAKRKILSHIFNLHIPWTVVDITLQDENPLTATMERIDTVGRNYTIDDNLHSAKHYRTKTATPYIQKRHHTLLKGDYIVDVSSYHYMKRTD